jgi:hypothetical protein
MGITVEPYTEKRVAAVKAFNQRLAAGGIAREFQFPESSTPYWLPKVEDRRIYQEYYVAADGDEVRGGFILKHQAFFVKGQTRPVVYYHLPVSEGIVNRPTRAWACTCCGARCSCSRCCSRSEWAGSTARCRRC